MDRLLGLAAAAAVVALRQVRDEHEARVGQPVQSLERAVARLAFLRPREIVDAARAVDGPGAAAQASDPQARVHLRDDGDAIAFERDGGVVLEVQRLWAL